MRKPIIILLLTLSFFSCNRHYHFHIDKEEITEKENLKNERCDYDAIIYIKKDSIGFKTGHDINTDAINAKDALLLIQKYIEGFIPTEERKEIKQKI